MYATISSRAARGLTYFIFIGPVHHWSDRRDIDKVSSRDPISYALLSAAIGDGRRL